ncbi:putative hydrolase [Stieleria varia]|uniref:Putative hydrolase n=1 Tax=Stieleria varia TaxID=2528005 RepID=A0A5C5ZZ33_9BACT|nr:putative hydrolase [Stieleria varia]
MALPDGDSIVLHWDDPIQSVDRRGAMLLIHGLSGCHGSPYMIRLADRFVHSGFVTVRMDMRGCGAARELAQHLSHAGRSEDILEALTHIAKQMPGEPLHAIGVSLGGNQLLRLAGRLGGELDPRPRWLDALKRIAVVAPPMDLVRCSENMQRASRRPYNWYFIRQLFQRMPERVRQRVQQSNDMRSMLSGKRPRTLFELDDRLTAPLSGFAGANEYYQACGARSVVSDNAIETLILAAEDDPIVPVDCFRDPAIRWPESTRVLISPSGGHAGFVGRRGEFWMDNVLTRWFDAPTGYSK